MGSSGSFGAYLRLKTTRKLERSGRNTKAEIEALLEELGQPPLKEVAVKYEDVKREDIGKDYLGFSATFWYEDMSTLDGEDQFFQEFDEYYEEVVSNTCGIRAFTMKEMEVVDLLILREYTLAKKPVPLDVNIYRTITSVGGSIYGRGNEEVEDVKLTSDHLKLLQNPNTTLELTATGDSEHY